MRSKLLVTPAQAKAELLRRSNAAIRDKTIFDVGKFLFKEQLALVNDPARQAIAVCSTRAGKTVACAADLINTALQIPNTVGFYITLARSSAKRIVWPRLQQIIKDYKIDAKCNKSDLSVQFANGSFIYLTGANTDNEVQKIRGMSRVALIYIDECQSFRSHLKDLIDNVLAKRLYDLNGRLVLIGTPGPVLSGYFYEIWQGTSWSHHHWTMFQNPWLKEQSGFTAAELTEQDCKSRGITKEHPSIQRENYGKWVLDIESLLLKYDPAINNYLTLPNESFNYILGVDLGQRDANFLSLLAFNDNSSKTWLVHESAKYDQRTDDLAKDIRELMSKYPISKIICDAGALGLTIVEDLKAIYGLPIEAADKKGKLANYARMNNALRNGTFLARSNSIFANDCNIIERDLEKSTPDKTVIKGHSDAIDACLYAFKFSPAYMYEPPKAKNPEGSAEYMRAQAEEIWNKQREMNNANKGSHEQITWQTDHNGIPSWNRWDD